MSTSTLSPVVVAPAVPVDRLAYKTNDAARLSGVSVQTMRRLVERGQIKANRNLRHVLISRAELERFIAG